MMAIKSRIRSLFLVALSAVAILAGATVAAAETKTAKSDETAEDQPILITADQLISDNEEKFAEFIGNVKATQADFVITSDKLRIYYRGELLDTEEKENANKDNEEMLKKIIATGNVKINSTQYIAESDLVEYDTDAMTITLTGENSKVISGKNSLTGSKIILYRKDGRVKVFGSQKKRVEATFYSGGKASDAFKVEKPKE
jgi:lipopolysaccharide transport protein LptA